MKWLYMAIGAAIGLAAVGALCGAVFVVAMGLELLGLGWLMVVAAPVLAAALGVAAGLDLWERREDD